jgi:hypothetical protein
MSDYLQRLSQARIAWRAALGHAERLGRDVAEGFEASPQALAGLKVLADEAQQRRFPLAYASASSAAEAFRHLAAGFLTAERAEIKAALGAAMAEAARCCQRLLEIEDLDLAAAHSRRIGGD